MNKIYSSRYVYLFFFLYSFTFGMIFPRIGDLQIQMGIGESYLGLALSGLPIGVQVASLPFKDELVLRIMKEIEMEITFDTAPAL